jgi:hypothetical protein
MAAKIGILGEGTATTTGTVTLYTVPADKAARVRILFAVENAASAFNYSVFVGSPGSEIHIHEAAGSGEDVWSGVLRESTPDPANAHLLSAIGMHRKSSGIILTSLTDGIPFWIAPLPTDFFLSTGDTVRVNINANAVTNHLIQVVGVEDDA